ncbi:MAG: methyltransferase domain-containing protein [Spirochaetota bacterium]|jgi:chemotaxis protein methyltransferase CheR|nr:methyltransferase domain-containing protein [Spirochaetota bacterium]
MDPKIFNQLKTLIYDASGITLTEQKETLVSTRLAKRLRVLKMETHEEYLAFLDNGRNSEELVSLLDVISTNVTSFFREVEHFDFTEKVMTEWLAEGQNRFRFWSAASSSGEEPYSLAMKLCEIFGGKNVDAKILATDISTKVLALCMEGVYPKERLATVPKPMLDKYFTRIANPEGGEESYKVRPILQNMIAFRRINLSTPPFSIHGPIDIVFCRNVMIYFDKDVRTRLLSEIYRVLRPGGYLFVGHSESLTSLKTEFTPVRPAIYYKKV